MRFCNRKQLKIFEYDTSRYPFRKAVADILNLREQIEKELNLHKVANVWFSGLYSGLFNKTHPLQESITEEVNFLKEISNQEKVRICLQLWNYLTFIRRSIQIPFPRIDKMKLPRICKIILTLQSRVLRFGFTSLNLIVE